LLERGDAGEKTSVRGVGVHAPAALRCESDDLVDRVDGAARGRPRANDHRPDHVGRQAAQRVDVHAPAAIDGYDDGAQAQELRHAPVRVVRLG